MNPISRIVLALAFVAGAASAQVYPYNFPNVEAAGSSITDDQDVALICMYVGTSGAGFVTVAADGNLAFESPDSSTADTTFECPVSGGLGGIIDVSNAACNTVTEVLNIVNTPTSNFRCIPYAILGTDDLDISGTGWLLAVTDQACAKPDGCRIVSDTDTALKISNVVAPSAVWASGKKYFTAATSAGGSKGIFANPWSGQRGFLTAASTLSTYGSGTSVTNVYSVKGEFLPYQSSSTSQAGYTYSETISTVWGPVTNGATTVFKTFGSCDTAATACGPEWGSWGVLGQRDSKLLVRITNSAALATTSLQLNGSLYLYK